MCYNKFSFRTFYSNDVRVWCHLLIILSLTYSLSAQRNKNHAIVFPGGDLFHELKLSNEFATRFRGSVGGRCVIGSGTNGVCVPLNECSELRSLYQPGRRLSRRNFQILRQRICRVFNDRRILFCCSTGRNADPGPDNASTARPTPSPIIENPSNLIPTMNECGISVGGKITDGKEIRPHSHPWLVNLGHFDGDKFVQVCGGAFLTRRHVLTAAHCFLPQAPRIDFARFGDHSLSKEEPEPVVTVRIIDRKSPGYDSRSQENDLQLLKLERDVPFTANIRPACWPTNFKNKDFTGINMTIVGWGDTFFRSNTGNDIVLGANVPVVPKEDCLQAYSRQRSIVIDNRQLCAGDGGEDACQGDSGGPMIYRDQTLRNYLVGIVSFGVGCGRDDFPGVYSFVPQFLDWIIENL